MTNSRRLVVFFPGLGFSPMTEAFCEPMAKKFRKQGYDTKIWHYDYHGMAHIKDHLSGWSNFILNNAHKYEHITAIGHSMGGLVVRSLDGAYVDAIVTIATPHKGYRTIWEPFVGFCPAGGDMKKDSIYLKVSSRANLVRTLQVIGTRDLVVEASCQVWEESKKQGSEILERDSGHLGIMLQDQTFWEIWAWLTFNEDPDENLLYYEGQGVVL